MEMTLKPSQARLNLIDNEIVSDGDDDSVESSSDSFEVDLDIKQLQRSISVTSVQSAMNVSNEKNSSTTNLLVAPSASATSVNESCIKYFINEVKQNASKEENLQHEDSGLEFSREELQARLQNLVLNSILNFNGDPEVK